MFNVAVVNVKDILKYLVSITVTLCLVMFVTRYFSNLNENEKNKISQIMQTNLLVCLDEIIPGIKETNRELNNNEESLINAKDILGNLLKIELAMFKQEQKIAEVENATSSQVENIETKDQEVQEEKTQQIENSRRNNHTSSNTKSIIRQL